MNKKIKNAKEHVYNDIKFKSGLEVFTYKKLVENYFNFTYENVTLELIPSFELKKTIALFPNTTGLDTKTIINRCGSRIQRKKYKPDFVIEYKNYYIVLEVKGWGNDLWGTVRKLALYNLEHADLAGKIPVFLECHSQKQVIECINFIKQLCANVE